MWVHRFIHIATLVAASSLFGAAKPPAKPPTNPAPVTQNVRYKRFPESVSPDGNYAIAWGDRIDGATTRVTFTEVPYATPRSDLAQMNGVEDYLVETRGGKGPMPIPKAEYFSGIEGHEAKRGLTVAWSPDSRGALVIYEGVEASLAAVWINAEAKTTTDVSIAIEMEARKAVYASPGRTERAKWRNFHFSRVAVLRPGVLTVDVCLVPPLGFDAPEDDVCVRLRFKVASEQSKAKFELATGRVLREEERKEEPEFTAEGLEAEMNELFTKLRDKTDLSDRNALRNEQEQWLRLRFLMPSDANKFGFTRRRVAELRIRLEELGQNRELALPPSREPLTPLEKAK